MSFLLRGALILALCLSPTATPAQTDAQEDTTEPATQRGEPIDFLSAYALARNADPTWLAAQARQRADAQERAIGRAGLRPSASYSYNRARNWSNIREGSIFGPIDDNVTYDSYASVFTITQPLFDAAARARYREGVARSKAGDFTAKRAEQALAVRVLQAYSDLLYATDDLKLAEAHVTALDEDQRRVDRFVVLGEGTRTDKVEVEAQQHLAAAKVLEARDRLRAARTGLRELIGPVVDGEPVGLNGTCVPFPGPREPLETWRQRLLDKNPELAAERSMVEVARREVDRERAAGLPRIALFGRQQLAESNAENQIGQRYNTGTVGVQLQMPLYSGGGVIASTRQARGALDEARHKLDGATFELIDDLEKQWNLVEMSPMRIDAYARAATSAAARVEATRRSMMGGERTNADVLDAQEQRLEALRDLARARYDYLLAWLSLRWQAGTLEDDDITRVGACFSAPAATPTRQ